ncbi:MAG TPA: hypothetical protein VGM56_13715 [Byssovorax sp.]|jgi:hypothetical protein
MTRLSAWFLFSVIGLSAAASVGTGCSTDSCSQLSDQCDSCSGAFALSCRALVNEANQDACNASLNDNEFASCGGNGKSSGTGESTASGSSGGCGQLSDICDTCNTHDPTQNSLKTSCESIVRVGSAQVCNTYVQDNAFGACGSSSGHTVSTGVGAGSSSSHATGVGGGSSTSHATGVGGGSSTHASSSHATGVGGGSSTHASSSHASSVSSTGSGNSCSGLMATGDTACDLCLDNHCCQQTLNCTNPSDACEQYDACLQGGETEQQCEQAVPNGLQESNAFGMCAQSSCDQACANVFSQICMSGITTGLAACDTCLSSACCAAWTAVGTEGQQGIDDLNACATDSTCNGDMHAQQAMACETGTCASSCM